jgi:hypothetical protein
LESVKRSWVRALDFQARAGWKAVSPRADTVARDHVVKEAVRDYAAEELAQRSRRLRRIAEPLKFRSSSRSVTMTSSSGCSGAVMSRR